MESATQTRHVGVNKKIEADKELRDEMADWLQEENEVCEPAGNLGDDSDPLELTKSEYLKRYPGRRLVKSN